jgi:molybdate transport system permease protein
MPLARPGLITAAVLGFAHTLGEFGVVLMIGGNIPGETRVASIAIYDHVESMDYSSAHWLAALMLLISFLLLVVLFAVNRRFRLIRS